LYVTLSITFSTAYTASTRRVQAQVIDHAGNTFGWQQVGIWGQPQPQPEPPSFRLSVTPGSQTVYRSGPHGVSTIMVTPLNGFNSSVTLRILYEYTTVPGVGAYFPPASSSITVGPAGSTPIYMWAGPLAPLGLTSFVVIGESGALNQVASLSMNVQQGATPSFSLTATPPVKTVPTPGAASHSIGVTPVYGFSGSVTISGVAGLPPGATVNAVPPISGWQFGHADREHGFEHTHRQLRTHHHRRQRRAKQHRKDVADCAAAGHLREPAAGRYLCITVIRDRRDTNVFRALSG
jgi:hypothetical protein